MKKRLSISEYIFLASMLFGMFFGAGNLIFPALMGQCSGSRMWPAAIGFCITGVGLPLLSIAAIGMSSSEGLFDMSCKVGKGFAYVFTCALYLSIGPLFAIPRTSTVSFQVGVYPLLSGSNEKLALLIFTFIFFAIALYFSLKPSGILTWIGKILNPLFLVFLALLVITALINPMGGISNLEPDGLYETQSFFTGFLEGYNTMDVLAGLAFGIVLVNEIKRLGINEPSKISYSAIVSGMIGMILMAAIYIALTYIGAQSRNVYGIDNNGGDALHHIASYYFGSLGGLILGIIITVACLKTAIGLITSCATTFSELFSNGKSYNMYAIIFSVFSFAISNVGLSKIIEYSLPALYLLYPIAIVLILLCLFGGLFNYDKKVLISTLAFTTAAAVLDFIKALPEFIHNILPGYSMLESISTVLPLSKYGTGWVIPAAAGLVVGLILHIIKKH